MVEQRKSAIDHLVVTAPSLAAGIRYVEESLGCRMHPGGQHPRMGTHNAVLKIGPREYLEVIAIDPDAAPIHRARWFELDLPLPETRPRLATWVMRTNCMHEIMASSEMNLGTIEEMSRGSLEWLITIAVDGRLIFRGLAPALIQWKADTHPVEKLPESAVSLMRLEGHHPEARRVSHLLNQANFQGPVSMIDSAEVQPVPLVALMQTPRGIVAFS